MSQRLLVANPLTGLKTYFSYDAADDTFTVESRQDAELPLAMARAQRVDTDRHTRYRDGLHKVATIPLTVLMELSKKGIVSAGGAVLDKAAFARWLNDPDNRAFRTREGRV